MFVCHTGRMISQNNPRQARGFLRGVLCSFALALVAGTIWWSSFKTYHLAKVDQGILYRSGLRTMHEFKAGVRQVHAHTIVRLVDEKEQAKAPFAAEAAWCKARGLEVIDIPISLGGQPEVAQIRQFIAVTRDRTKEPVLVHCAQGVRRTGMMVAAYQRAVLGWNSAQTKAAILPFGHTHMEDIQDFIDRYEPTNGTIAARSPEARNAVAQE